MLQFHELPACARYYRQPALENAVGMIPTFLSESDPRSGREQFRESYIDGWRPTRVGFKTTPGPVVEGHWCLYKLSYPGDPPMPPLAYTLLRDEMIIIYPSAWVMILQPDGSHEIARMD